MKKHHALLLATVLAIILTPQIFAQKVTISPLPQKITWGEKAFANNQPITIKGDKTADADAVAILKKNINIYLIHKRILKKILKIT